jgi:hypothetical protein
MIEGTQRSVEDGNGGNALDANKRNEEYSASDAKKVLDEFTESIMQESWGTLSRTQLNAALFRLLVDAGKIDLTKSDQAIANQLLTTPSKVSNLRYQYDQYQNQKDDDYYHDLLKMTGIIVSIAPKNSLIGGESGKRLAVRIENKFLLAKVKQKVEENDEIPWTGLTANVIYVDADNFLDFFFKICGRENSGEGSIYLAVLRKIKAEENKGTPALDEEKKNLTDLREDLDKLTASKYADTRSETWSDITEKCKKLWPLMILHSPAVISKLISLSEKILGIK